MRFSPFLPLVFALYFLGAFGAHSETTETVTRNCPAGAAEDWWDHTETGTDVEGCANPSHLQTAATVGCTMSIAFKGTAAYLNALMAFDRGIITVSIDGGSSERVDASGGLIGRKCGQLWSRTNLEDKDHTMLITIVATGGDDSAKFEFVSLTYTVSDAADQPNSPNPPTPSATTTPNPPADPQTSTSQSTNPSTPTSSTTLLTSDRPPSSGSPGSSTQPTSAADRAPTSDTSTPSSASQPNPGSAGASTPENANTTTVPTGAIAGAAVGAIALVAFLIILFILYRRRQRRAPTAPVSPFVDTHTAPMTGPYMSQGALPHTAFQLNLANQSYSSSGLAPNRTSPAQNIQENALPYPYNFGGSFAPGSQDSHVPLSAAYGSPLTTSSRTESTVNDHSIDRSLPRSQPAPVNEKSPRLVDISTMDQTNRRSVAAGSVLTSSSARTGRVSEGGQRGALSESEIERIAQRVAAISAQRSQMPPPAYE